jgi:hypothetical protein
MLPLGITFVSLLCCLKLHNTVPALDFRNAWRFNVQLNQWLLDTWQWEYSRCPLHWSFTLTNVACPKLHRVVEWSLACKIKVLDSVPQQFWFLLGSSFICLRVRENGISWSRIGSITNNGDRNGSAAEAAQQQHKKNDTSLDIKSFKAITHINIRLSACLYLLSFYKN